MQYSTVISWSFALILLLKGAAAQDSLNIRAQFSPEQPVQRFMVDRLDQIYWLTRSHELIKIDKNGQWVGNHRNQRLGPLAQVDVSNPLQLLLFYPETSTLLQLDNMLYTTNSFSLERLNLSNNSLVCRSFDNNFWLYDARAFSLRKIANDLRVVIAGEWLQNKISKDLQPTALIESGERLYLNDPENGIHQFDLYGAYLKTLPIRHQKSLVVFADELYYLENGQLFAYHTQLLSHRPLQLPAGINIKQFAVNQRGLWVFDGERLFLLAR